PKKRYFARCRWSKMSQKALLGMLSGKNSLWNILRFTQFLFTSFSKKLNNRTITTLATVAKMMRSHS
ncbi:MAG TPA: hypothetical protein V6D29_21345, partial [Leptolyngbyaceae cyanobacterium]